MKKKICILGSTGSIGKTTLKIISKNKKDFNIVLLSGNNNVKLLIAQAKKFKPKYIYSNNFYFKEKLKIFCKNNNIYLIDDLNLLKKVKFDITVAAISGIAGLIPTINIIKFSKKILIAINIFLENLIIFIVGMSPAIPEIAATVMSNFTFFNKFKSSIK